MNFADVANTYGKMKTALDDKPAINDQETSSMILKAIKGFEKKTPFVRFTLINNRKSVSVTLSF